MVPYRETIARKAIAERKYIRYFNGRGHFAHLQLEIIPRPGKLPSMTTAESLSLPVECLQAAHVALFRRMDRGPIHGFPMVGIELRLLAATHLPAYSYPDAFAVAASMAFDEAMIQADPVVVEPWVLLRLRVADHALQATIQILTRFLGSVRADVSRSDHFVLHTEIPARLEEKLAQALGLAMLDTASLDESKRYRRVSGSIDRETFPSSHGDWT